MLKGAMGMESKRGTSMIVGANRSWKALTILATVSLGGAILAACGSSSSSSTSSSSQSSTSSNAGVITMAEGAQGTPDSILPFVEPAYNTLANKGSFQNFMWPYLYTIGTANSATALNTALSLAYAPVFSQNDSVVTIKLKPWKWSNGQPLTNADLMFFLDLLKYEKNEFGDYVPGDIPDSIKSVSTVGTSTVVLHLTESVNPIWFTDDQLDELVPMPQQSWDKTSTAGSVGNYASTASGAAAVLSYLSAQSKDTSTYATNPLWKVVDGPFELTSFNTTGAASFKVNPNYSGPKVNYKVFKEVPYTSSSSEFSSLLSGSEIQAGYVPANDLSTLPRVKAAGYSIVPTPYWEINFLSLNYINPQVGSIFKQLYIRQALQHLMDQSAVVKSLLLGTGGYPDYGPIPPKPSNPYMGSLESASTYPYSIKDARTLLTSHGWKIPSSGPAVCEKPGPGANECGTGISGGQTLTFSLVYTTGSSISVTSSETINAVATASGVIPEVAGKPHAAMAQVIQDRFALTSASAVVVGDQPGTDGRLAQRLGVPFALVDSGVTPAGTVVDDVPVAIRSDGLVDLVDRAVARAPGADRGGSGPVPSDLGRDRS